MPIILDVPYEEKDFAKESGARWEPKLKKWYVPDTITNLSTFKKWRKHDTYIKSPLYFVMGERVCWKCSKNTPLVAIGANKFISLLDIDDNGNEIWDEYDFSLFFNIENIPDLIKEYVEKYFPYFRCTYSKFTNSKYWANTCIHCGSLQGDNYVHEEVGDGFDVQEEEDAKKIRIIEIPIDYDIGIDASYYTQNDGYLLLNKYARRISFDAL